MYIRARGLRSFPTSPTTALTKYFLADGEINVYPLFVSCFFFISTSQ